MRNDELILFQVKQSPPKFHVSPGQIFDRAVLSVYRSEYEHVREDTVLFSASHPRVPCNARLNLCRKAADLSAHVSAARTKTARGRGMRSRILIPGRTVQLCHTAKGPSGGAFGLRWSLPAPVPRRDIKSERRSLSFLVSFVKEYPKTPAPEFSMREPDCHSAGRVKFTSIIPIRGRSSRRA